MDEIPHLLRRGVGTGSPEDVRDAEELMDKAADEIERLRKALLWIADLESDDPIEIAEFANATLNIHK